MSSRGWQKYLFAAALGFAGTQTAAALAQATIPPPPVLGDTTNTTDTAGSTSQTGMEAMTRGPVHEAFAQPVNTGGTQPFIVPKKPPGAIDEIPPDAKPADESAVWIGGYWSWSDDRKDFLWVSGVWRVPPVGSQWVAGYWSPATAGYQWNPGFWSPAASQAVEYYPQPPASLEQGPSSDPPSSDYFWTPGCWRWRAGRFVWQAGFWAMAQPGWVWMPASYCFSPRGWIFCDGYWDYPLDRRGLAFAPIWFSDRSYLGRNFTFAPTVAIDPGILSFYLFVRPDYCHYYFGDYFAADYDALGIYPWCGMHRYRNYRYDPLFAYDRWYFGTRDPQWANNLLAWHSFYRAHPHERPPHDLAGQTKLLAHAGDRADRKFLSIGEPLASWRNNPNAPLKLVNLSAGDKTRFQDMTRATREFQVQRLHLETGGKTLGTAAGATALKAPLKLSLPKVAGALPQYSGSAANLGLLPHGSQGFQQGGIQHEVLKPIIPGNKYEGQAEGTHETYKPVIPHHLELPQQQFLEKTVPHQENAPMPLLRGGNEGGRHR